MFFNITKYSVKNILRNKFLTISTILVLTLLMFFINVLQILEWVSVKIISEINAKLNFSLYLKDWITKDSVEVSTLEKNIKEIDKDIVFDYKTKDKILLEMTSVLGIPMVEFRAGSWRLILVISILSPSMMVIFPIPERTKNSVANEPTPPNPITKIFAFWSFLIPFVFINSSVRCSHSFCMIFLFKI